MSRKAVCGVFSENYNEKPKYRINVHNNGEDNRYYTVQKRTWIFWITAKKAVPDHTNGVDFVTIQFKNYNEAAEYILERI